MALASINIKAMTKLVSAMDDAVSNLPYDRWGLQSALEPVDVDASPANGLTKVVNWVSGQVPGVKRRLALAQAIEAQKPGWQDNVDIDESKLSTLDPATAQDMGAAAAKKLKDCNGKLDKDLLAEIAQYQNDPYFAAGFAKGATPAELAQVVLQAWPERSSELQHALGAAETQKIVSDFDANYPALLNAVGTTIATATRNTGNLAMPSDYAKQWTDTITADPKGPGNPPPPVGLGAAASLLLRSGTFGTSFLDTVSTGVYDYEREHGKDGPVWSPRSLVENDPDGAYQGPYLPGGKRLSDPMASIMLALSHNPEAAQHFFTGGDQDKVKINGQDVPVNGRLKYLIQDRTWANSGDTASDEGNGLGAALQAASTFYRDNTPDGKIPSQVSAQIAAQSFALIGSHTGDGKSDGFLGIGSHEGWKMWSGMRPYVAQMVASYAPDLILTVGWSKPQPVKFGGNWVVAPDPSNDLFPPNGPPSAWMDPELMKNVISTLGEDPKNMDIVNTGIAASGRLMLTYAAQRGLKIDPNAPSHIIAGTQGVPALTGAANALARTLGFAIDAGYHGDKSSQEFQKKRAEEMSKVIGLVTSVPGLKLPDGHEWSQFLLDQVKDKALEKIGEGPKQDAKDVYNTTSADYQTKLQQMTLNALLENGYFGDQHYAAANPPNAPHEFESPFDPKYANQNPPAVSKADDGTLQFNFDSQAYRDWEQNGQALNSWIQNNVTGPYRDHLPAYGD